MEYLVRIDDKGRIVIPLEIRKKFKLRKLVILRVENDKIIIQPIKDPIEMLTSTIIKGSRDIEKEIPKLRKIAEEEALKGM